jgi:hypothetical protein
MVKLTQPEIEQFRRDWRRLHETLTTIREFAPTAQRLARMAERMGEALSVPDNPVLLAPGAEPAIQRLLAETSMYVVDE